MPGRKGRIWQACNEGEGSSKQIYWGFVYSCKAVSSSKQQIRLPSAHSPTSCIRIVRSQIGTRKRLAKHDIIRRTYRSMTRSDEIRRHFHADWHVGFKWTAYFRISPVCYLSLLNASTSLAGLSRLQWKRVLRDIICKMAVVRLCQYTWQ